MRTLILAGTLGAAFLFFILPSCKHDPLWNPDGGPDPSGPNPIDSSIYSGWPCSPDTAYFQNEVLPILISGCSKSGCHDAQSHKEGIILVDYQSVISTGKVKAYKPNDSKLYEVLIETGGDRMPEPPNAPLNAAQIAIIKKWIEQGAKNTACNENYGNCTTTGLSYTNFVAPLMTNYCTGCHGGVNPQGSLKLSTYDEVKASVQSGKLYGAVAHQPGYSFMPKGGAALSPCNVDKIKAWIDGGMLQ